MTVTEEVAYGTVRDAANFDPQTDAGVLRKAMEGLGKQAYNYICMTYMIVGIVVYLIGQLLLYVL